MASRVIRVEGCRGCGVSVQRLLLPTTSARSRWFSAACTARSWSGDGWGASCSGAGVSALLQSSEGRALGRLIRGANECGRVYPLGCYYAFRLRCRLRQVTVVCDKHAERRASERQSVSHCSVQDAKLTYSCRSWIRRGNRMQHVVTVYISITSILESCCCVFLIDPIDFSGAADPLIFALCSSCVQQRNSNDEQE